MNYLNRMLQPGEEIVFRTRLHPLVFIKPLIVAVFVGFLAFSLPPEYVPYVGILIIGVVIPYTALVALSLALGDVAVTNRRVLLRMGALRGQMTEVLLHKIRAVAADNRAVTLELAGGMVRTVSFIRDPDGLAQAIERSRKRLQADNR
ncbi:MAG: hypothetical protein LPJ91_02080 [Pseudazoarcus pumilus]|nr:hypothetical protein [Pseudazoarcus pumilus]